eukprot:TRINITY_DN26575_c0_g1_i2.p1 TRINITY_DN26575_c0_g1~~TRINITY_DN26575_c0_g1_i2.p1  ORF type:complete len:346 (+),score=75.73 TRINITY_DN26575_c0_g1_i2:62-1099(+)
MVNYDKWNNIDVSDDEDDRPSKPRVTNLGGQRSVTFGGKDGSLEVKPMAVAAPREEETQAAGADDDEDDDEPMEIDDGEVVLGSDHREDVLQCQELAQRALRRSDFAEAVRLLEKALRMDVRRECPGLQDMLDAAKRQATPSISAAQTTQSALGATPLATTGGYVQTTVKHEPPEANGATVGERYRWTQSREIVEMHIYVPETTKSKDVTIKVTESTCDVRVSGNSVFSGAWEFKVDPEEDPDWELRHDDGRRAIRLLVRKAQLPGGMSIAVWWKRVLKGDPAIDVSGIQGRKREASESMAKAWAEAHAMFREKAANRQKIPVDVSTGRVGDDDIEEDSSAPMEQ